ncbi:MAG: SDR family oxidoreductase [Hyphomicrobiales bacterium]|nr:SDR family oxidoreductase [Hyphomicrobiales bacterium]
MARALITGANRGIGLEVARQLAARGDEVIAACRSPSPELRALGVEVVGGVDVADDGSVAGLAEAVGDRPLDMVLNNAGILTSESLDDLDLDRIRAQFEVNTLGPLRVTKALLPRLGHGTKVAIVSSWMGSLAENASGGSYGYRISKCAVNMAGLNLAHDLKPRGVAVVLLHPGYVRTEMTAGGGTVEPEDAARGLIARIDALTLDNTGTFWHAEGHELPW